MTLLELLKFSADSMSPGAIAPAVRNRAVRPGDRGMEADTSASDLASHHTWEEPSASDDTIKRWLEQRIIERRLGRSLDPFEMF